MKRKKVEREAEKCIKFLERNGWKLMEPVLRDAEFISYYKHDYLGIDIGEDSIVIIGEVGDIAHLSINYYELIGALVVFRQVGFPKEAEDIKW